MTSASTPGGIGEPWVATSGWEGADMEELLRLEEDVEKREEEGKDERRM